MLPPFNLMPRSALTAAGDAVMGQLMRTLLPLFMNKCARPAALASWCCVSALFIGAVSCRTDVALFKGHTGRALSSAARWASDWVMMQVER